MYKESSLWKQRDHLIECIPGHVRAIKRHARLISPESIMVLASGRTIQFIIEEFLLTSERRKVFLAVDRGYRTSG